jgi:hypothetical protein
MQEHDSNTRYYHKQKTLTLNVGIDTSEGAAMLSAKGSPCDMTLTNYASIGSHPSVLLEVEAFLMVGVSVTNAEAL